MDIKKLQEMSQTIAGENEAVTQTILMLIGMYHVLGADTHALQGVLTMAYVQGRVDATEALANYHSNEETKP